MDLFGPARTLSLGGKQYDLIIIDDYSSFEWTLFLAHKDETFPAFIKLFKKISNEQNSILFSIRRDHGSEFDNNHFKNFCNEYGIDPNFSAPRILQ